MQLKKVNKARYRKHLKIVFVAIVFFLIVIALSTSTIFIYLFSNPQDSHFAYNLAGVIVAAVIVVMLLIKLRQHPYMLEVVYVWDLKQQLNRIYRKQRKIEALLENNDPDAMIVMNFQYRGSKQLYELDDNTITMDGLNIKIELLAKRMKTAGLSLSTDSYNPTLLEQF